MVALAPHLDLLKLILELVRLRVELSAVCFFVPDLSADEALNALRVTIFRKVPLPVTLEAGHHRTGLIEMVPKTAQAGKLRVFLAHPLEVPLLFAAPAYHCQTAVLVEVPNRPLHQVVQINLRSMRRRRFMVFILTFFRLQGSLVGRIQRIHFRHKVLLVAEEGAPFASHLVDLRFTPIAGRQFKRNDLHRLHINLKPNNLLLAAVLFCPRTILFFCLHL